jgi:trimeric autotransporter adhesin
LLLCPSRRWNFKQDANSPHIGPMAQDFYAAFGVGPDDKHIATVDADGVALAAIQGLNRKLEAELERKQLEITHLPQRLDRLERMLNSR